MATMWLNLAKLYEWNNALFDDFRLPVAPTPVYEGQYVDGIPDVDKEYVVDNLLFETYEQEVLYADPYIMQKMIGAWSKKNVDRWQKLYNTFWYRYNPIWNKDGTVTELETETRDLEGTRNTTGSGTSEDSETETRNLAGSRNTTGSGTTDEDELETRNLAGSKTTSGSIDTTETETATSESETTGTATSTDSVAGFNSPNTLTANKQNVLNHTDDTTGETDSTKTIDTDTTGTEHTTDTGTIERERAGETTATEQESTTDTGTVRTARNGETSTSERIGTTDTGTIEREYKRAEQGNIGVTATQALIERERAINDYSIYDIIIADFKKQFILSVY